MPRKASPYPLLTPLYHQAANTVATLRQDIAQREKELAVLKAQMARWQKVANHQGSVTKIRAAKSARVDWTALLQGLPARFATKEVATKAGKPLPQIYARIWRWAKEKKITKDKTGYRKLSSVRS